MNAERRKEIGRMTREFYDSLHALISSLGENLQAVLDEEQEAYDNLPEGIRESDRGDQMSDCIDHLETVIGCCEDEDETSVFYELESMLETCEVEL